MDEQARGPTTSARNSRIALATVTLVLAASVTVAWFVESRNPIEGTDASSYRVVVTRSGNTLRSFDLASLRGLGVKRVIAQGQAQEGPTLLAVLADAGVGDFVAVDVVGQGTRDRGRLSLTRAQIDADIVLAIAKRGTVKVAGPDIPADQRVRDVTELRVR
jgi:hypothetical protein